MKRIAMFSGSRSEFGLLKNLALLLQNSKKIKFDLIISGSHLSKLYGNTQKEIKNERIKIFKKINLYLEKEAGTPKNISKNSIILISKLSDYFFKYNPSLIILLGDRYETYIAAFISTLCKIKIAHIHGGEVTRGSKDDLYRHAITKMSNLHFVSTHVSKKRIRQMGEDIKSIYNFGAMCNDNIDNLKKYSFNKTEQLLGTKFLKKNIIVTYHPETSSKKINVKNLVILFDSLKNLKDTRVIFTAPNIDENSEQTIGLIKRYSKINKNFYFKQSLGFELYLNTLRYCDLSVGNSSSGIIETGLMKKFSINLGKRQDGRVQTKYVINCSFNKKLIENCILDILNKRKLFKNHKKNPYNGNNVSKKIYKTITKEKLSKVSFKEFRDI